MCIIWSQAPEGCIGTVTLAITSLTITNIITIIVTTIASMEDGEQIGAIFKTALPII
jgi:hypothetical protein